MSLASCITILAIASATPTLAQAEPFEREEVKPLDTVDADTHRLVHGASDFEARSFKSAKEEFAKGSVDGRFTSVAKVLNLNGVTLQAAPSARRLILEPTSFHRRGDSGQDKSLGRDQQ